MPKQITREARLYRMAKKQGLRFRKRDGVYSIGVPDHPNLHSPYTDLDEAEKCIENGMREWKNDAN
jgi:hypothetical protein